MLLFTYKREVKSWKVEVRNHLGEKPTLDKRKLSFTRPHLTRPQIWHHALNIGNTQTYLHTQKITSKLCGVETRESTVTGTQLQTQLHCLVTLRVMDSVLDHVLRPNGLCKTRNSPSN